jgi:hypothetical protein
MDRQQEFKPCHITEDPSSYPNERLHDKIGLTIDHKYLFTGAELNQWARLCGHKAQLLDPAMFYVRAILSFGPYYANAIQWPRIPNIRRVIPNTKNTCTFNG